MEKLYNNIRNRRIELGMTQSELADKSGYTSKSMIARIESGLVDLPLSKVKVIAKALSVSADILLEWDEESQIQDEISSTLSLLNSEGQQRVLEYTRMIADQPMFQIKATEDSANKVLTDTIEMIEALQQHDGD